MIEKYIKTFGIPDDLEVTPLEYMTWLLAEENRKETLSEFYNYGVSFFKGLQK